MPVKDHRMSAWGEWVVNCRTLVRMIQIAANKAKHQRKDWEDNFGGGGGGLVM